MDGTAEPPGIGAFSRWVLRGLRDVGPPPAEVAVVFDGTEREGREVPERHLERMRDRTQAAETAIVVVLRSLATADGMTEARIGGVESAGAVRRVVPAAASDAASAPEAGVGPDVLPEIAAADRPAMVRSADQGGFTTPVMPVALDTSS